MKSFFSYLFCVPFAVCSCSHETSVNDSSPEAPYQATNGLSIAVVSSVLIPDKQKTIQKIASWCLRQSTTKVTWFDGTHEVTRFVVPRLNHFSEEAAANRIGQPFEDLVAWARPKDASAKPDTSVWSLPSVLPLVKENLVRPPAKLLILGSPVHRSVNPQFDFSNQFRVPDLGQLLHQNSPFHSADKSSLEGTVIYWTYPAIERSSWPAGFESALREFYSAFFYVRGGHLAYFGPDVGAMLEATSQPFTVVKSSNWLTNSPSLAMREFAVQPPKKSLEQTVVALPDTTKQPVKPIQNTRKESHVSSADVNRVDPAPSLNKATALGSNQMTGVTVVLDYVSDCCDGDVYLQLHSEAEEISYKRPSTALGSYRYVFQAGHHKKMINVPGGIDPSKALLYVNYRKGSGRLSGTVELLSEGGIRTSIPVSFFPLKGGDPDTSSPYWRKRSSYWCRINLTDLMPAR